MRTNLAGALLLVGVGSLLFTAACDSEEIPTEQIEATTYPVIGNWVMGKGVVMLTKKSDGTQFCSAVVVNKHSILTTARCLQRFLVDQTNSDSPSRLDPKGDYEERLVTSMLVVRNLDGTASMKCLNGGVAPSCGGKSGKRIITYRENPVASGDSDNDLALLYTSTYGYYG